MNIDYAEMPFEIWCDTLEDEGLTTEDLRLLFVHNNALGYTDMCGFGYRARYGDGNAPVQTLGDGDASGYHRGHGYGYNSNYDRNEGFGNGFTAEYY